MPTAAQLMVKCLENEGVQSCSGSRAKRTSAYSGAGRLIDPLCPHPPRAGCGVHGRDLRPRHRARRGGSATLGPGAINMQLGVADATTNSTPLVAISAQVGQDREYKESHQYVDLVSMFAPITRWSDRVPTSRAIPEMVRKAFKLARDRTPRPPFISLSPTHDADEAGLRPGAVAAQRRTRRSAVARTGAARGRFFATRSGPWCSPATVRHAVTRLLR